MSLTGMKMITKTNVPNSKTSNKKRLIIKQMFIQIFFPGKTKSVYIKDDGFLLSTVLKRKMEDKKNRRIQLGIESEVFYSQRIVLCTYAALLHN